MISYLPTIFTTEEIKICFLKNKILLNNNKEIHKVVFDSRECVENTLFFAIKGDNGDGHDYIDNAIQNGACFVICEKINNDLKTLIETKKINVICVENSITALQQLAIFHRNRLKSKVIGITGNIGKTTTREMLSTTLSHFYKIFAPNKNYNNHIGLPLTICNTPKDTEILILEMGMNHIGELDLLTKIAKPDIAVITPIASVHIGNFKDIDEVIKAKAEILNGLKSDGYLILDADNTIAFEKLYQIAKNKGLENITTIGKKGDFGVNNIEYNKNFTTTYDVLCTKSNTGKQIINCTINGLVAHNPHNSLFAFAVADILKLNLETFAQQLKKFHIVEGRGNIEELIFKSNTAIKNITLINDCYNSSPEALKSSILTLSKIKQIKQNKRSIAIIGDMLELGSQSQEFHKSIVPIIENNNINLVITIGNESKIITNILKHNNNIEPLHFETTEDFILNIDNIINNDDIILLKASHSMHFDKIIKFLEDNSK